jgi:hypothetical protein
MSSLEDKLIALLKESKAAKAKTKKTKALKANKPAGATGTGKKAKVAKVKKAKAPGLYMKGKNKVSKRVGTGAGKALGIKLNGKVLFKELVFQKQFLADDKTIQADGAVVYALQPEDVIVIEEIQCPSVVNTFPQTV